MNQTLIADVSLQIDTAQLAEGEGRWLDALAAYQSIMQDANVGAETRAHVQRRIGNLYFYRGDYAKAAEYYQASCEDARACGALGQLASGLNGLATARQHVGRLDDAEQLFKEALRYAEESNHGRLAVMIDQNLGNNASIRGDVATALQRYNAALVRYEQTNDMQGAAWVLNNLGMVHTEAERWSEALECFNRALSLSNERSDSDMQGTVQLNAACMHHRARNYELARASADRAFAIFTRIDSKQGLGEVAKLYGMLYRDAGKLQLAEAYLHVVVDIARSNDFVLLQAEAESEYALVHMAGGKNREALRSLNTSHRLFSDLKAQHRLLDIEKQLDRLEAKYLLVTKIWGESIESKDHYTGGHCGRVAEYAVKLAAAVGFSGRDLTWIKMGAFLHDVGKTAVDPAILTKDDRLDGGEWEAMKKHTLAGDEIVAELNFAWDIRPMVRNHHEHWDGTGYPDRLRGDAIPLTARILCIADVYDALTTTRNYREAYTPAAALEIMKKEAGTVLDPNLFAIFEKQVWPTLEG
jgi:putative nucleotidyltransferase with HDIG domain